MLTNFVITALALGSAVYLVRGDVRHGSVMLKRNLKTIRSWLEAEGAASGAPKPRCDSAGLVSESVSETPAVARPNTWSHRARARLSRRAEAAGVVRHGEQWANGCTPYALRLRL